MREIESERLISRRSLAQHGRPESYRRGAILPLVAMSIVGLMGLMALAVEAGSLHRERRTAQTAADAGHARGDFRSERAFLRQRREVGEQQRDRDRKRHGRAGE